MTWSQSNTLGSDELSALAADLPVFVPTNILRTSTVDPEWRTSGSWASGSDQTNGSAYGWLAYDGKATTQTRPTTTGSYTAISLLFDLTSSSGETGQIDSIAILNHNYADIAQLTGVYVEIDTANDFATNNETIASWTSFDSQRLVTFTVSDGTSSPRRLDSVQYLRIRHTFSSAPSVAPTLGEVIVGRRFQFASKGNVAFPEYPLHSMVSSHQSYSGVNTRHERYAGKFEASLSWTLGGALYSGIDRTANALGVVRRSNYGVYPVLYCEDPTTSPRDSRLVYIGTDTNIMQMGPLHREVSFAFDEEPPFLEAEIA